MAEVPKPVKVIIATEAKSAITLGDQRRNSIGVLSVEDYNIESSMDTDADTFGVTIGDPYGDLVDILKRDVEIRVQIFGGDDQSSYLKTGFVDSAVMNHDGTLTLSGRDVSALATDSTVPPMEWRNVFAHKRIKKDASKLGIPETKLQEVKKFAKIYTDGSETYWQFWYRMARKRKMWLWCTPNGTLVMDELNYAGDPTYFFGKPKEGFPGKKWVPVTACEITSNKQTRVGIVHYFGETNDTPYYATAEDPSIKSWLKRPEKVFFDSTIESYKEAKEAAFEEIFEGKVGAVEITLTIPDPGIVIRQNELAQLNLPEIGVSGLYYIVGTTINGSAGGGFTQTVRIREKGMALSRRVPDDPELIQDENQDLLTNSIFLDIPNHPEWAEFFVAAAKQWVPGGLPLDLFLATLLAMCEKESSFSNIRERGAPYGRDGIEWYEPAGRAFGQHRMDFANQDDNRFTGYKEMGVGPMQLTTRSYKDDADQHGGKSSEYEGGRWMPRSNIWVSAQVLVGKMSGLPHTKAGLKKGVERYNGAGSAAVAYSNDVMNAVDNKWLPMVQAAFASAQTLPGSGGTVVLPDGSMVDTTGAPAVVSRAVAIALQQLGKPYEWAATGPDTFDCSGLVYYAYKKAGMSNAGGRWSTYNMWPNRFPRVNKPELRVGDCVFFHGPPPSHMGMYIGSGNMVQAPSTGDVVKISSITSGYYASGYVGAQRPVAWPTGRPPGP